MNFKKSLYLIYNVLFCILLLRGISFCETDVERLRRYTYEKEVASRISSYNDLNSIKEALSVCASAIRYAKSDRDDEQKKVDGEESTSFSSKPMASVSERTQINRFFDDKRNLIDQNYADSLSQWRSRISTLLARVERMKGNELKQVDSWEASELKSIADGQSRTTERQEGDVTYIDYVPGTASGTTDSVRRYMTKRRTDIQDEYDQVIASYSSYVNEDQSGKTISGVYDLMDKQARRQEVSLERQQRQKYQDDLLAEQEKDRARKEEEDRKQKEYDEANAEAEKLYGKDLESGKSRLDKIQKQTDGLEEDLDKKIGFSDSGSSSNDQPSELERSLGQ